MLQGSDRENFPLGIHRNSSVDYASNIFPEEEEEEENSRKVISMKEKKKKKSFIYLFVVHYARVHSFLFTFKHHCQQN